MSAAGLSSPSKPGSLALRAFELWLALMAVESAHGLLRRAFLDPLIGDADSRRWGVVSGSALICFTVWLLRGWLRPSGFGARLAIGFAWVALTLTFEVALGLALGASPQRILSDYDLARGGLMPAGLLVLALAPLALVAREPTGERSV